MLYKWKEFLLEHYSENTQKVAEEINLYAKKYNLPNFKITGSEKSGKWYKDMWKSEIEFHIDIDEREEVETIDEKGWQYFFALGIGKNKEGKKHYTSDYKFHTTYDALYTRQLHGGYTTQKIESETEGFSQVEEAVKWIKNAYDNRRTDYPYEN